jgi:hypothetical protein
MTRRGSGPRSSMGLPPLLSLTRASVRRLPLRTEIGDHCTRSEPNSQIAASFGENSPRSEASRAVRENVPIFTSDFRCQANTLNSMAFNVCFGACCGNKDSRMSG